jgi:carnitine-CoA ligase
VPPQAIIEHAARYLAPFKVPRYIEYRTELPRTPSNKVRKPALLAEKPDLRADSWDRVDGIWR